MLVASRLRRADARTGWLIAVGGSFATTAVAFSFASGIFHPYYVSALAPFTAALVGAGVGQLAAVDDPVIRWLAPVAIAAGILSELYVVNHDASGLTWVEPLLLVTGITAGSLLVLRQDRRIRVAALAVALAALLSAPATWAAQTLGHATSGTFPAGGPADASFGGGGGPGGGFRRFGGTGGGGGMFGGEDLTSVLRYIEQHGGGTLAVSSQSGAGTAVREGHAVAGIGGFSGRESQVDAAWLAQAVRDGRIRWVVTTSSGPGGGFGGDTRVGPKDVMTAVQTACTAVGSSSGLYDCQGKADALAAAG